jgi:hypothetical protein
MMLPAVLVTLALSTAGAQSPAATPQNPNTVTLNGCVAANPTVRNSFTLDEDGRTYLLKGVSMRDYVGQRVELIGVAPRRLRIVGGLYPSPNIAAQPNDPTKAAMAAQSGPTSQSARPMIEFNVKSVRILTGTCPSAER